MTYKQINLKGDNIYLLPIPDLASDKPLSIGDKIILELYEEIENLNKEIYRLKVKANTYASKLVLEGFDDVEWEVTTKYH